MSGNGGQDDRTLIYELIPFYGGEITGIEFTFSASPFDDSEQLGYPFRLLVEKLSFE